MANLYFEYQELEMGLSKTLLKWSLFGRKTIILELENFKCIIENILCPEILIMNYIQKSIYIINQNIFRRHWHNLFYCNRRLVTLVEKF